MSSARDHRDVRPVRSLDHGSNLQLEMQTGSHEHMLVTPLHHSAFLVGLAPSYTNPSMWRCVPGSTFFTAELCHPGDRLTSGQS